MCMEDIRIGRQAYGNEGTALASASYGPLVGPAPDRISLTVYPDPTATLRVTSSPNPATGQGFFIAANGHPLVIDLEHHGRMVQEAFFVLASVGTPLVTYAEAMLDAR